jgi:hypothetical protein
MMTTQAKQIGCQSTDYAKTCKGIVRLVFCRLTRALQRTAAALSVCESRVIWKSGENLPNTGGVPASRSGWSWLCEPGSQPEDSRMTHTSRALPLLVLLLLLGCQSALPKARHRSLDETWSGLLSAMQAGRVSEVQDFTTERGLVSLQARVGDKTQAVAFRRWGAIWARWPLRWRTIADDHATAVMGPEVKEHGLEFVRTAQGWRLDQWTPGH